MPQEKWDAPLPDFMKPDADRGKENIGPEDTIWLGDAGDLDSDELLRRHGYDPIEPFSLLLLSIIDGNRDERGSAARLKLALNALLRSTRRQGRDKKDDYDVLLEIAWGYHEAKFRREEDPELAPIVMKCLDKTKFKSPETLDSEVRRLRDKFQEQKDLLLVRVTRETDLERMDDLRAVGAAADAIERLGVAIDRSTIRARLRRGEKTA